MYKKFDSNLKEHILIYCARFALETQNTHTNNAAHKFVIATTM
jgi:hypothetical protein